MLVGAERVCVHAFSLTAACRADLAMRAICWKCSTVLTSGGLESRLCWLVLCAAVMACRLQAAGEGASPSGASGPIVVDGASTVLSTPTANGEDQWQLYR